VTVLTGTPNYPDGKFAAGYGVFRKWRENYNGARVIRIPLVPRGGGSGVQLALNYSSFAVCASLLGPFLCPNKIDLIFVCQLSPVTVAIPAIVLKRLKKVPLLMWILDLWPESLAATGAIRSSGVLSGVEKLVRWIYRNADKIVVGSRGFINSVNAKGAGEEKVGYFPNWYEPGFGTNLVTSEFAPTRLPEGFLVMFAGNIGVAQDFESILAAAQRLQGIEDIHWIILGEGRRFGWLQEQVRERGLSDRIHLLGWHPQQEMAWFFAQADVMLVTIKRDPMFALTIPGKIQSYMACGRPIVAALDGEGGRLVVESGAGIASSSEDPEGLANAVLTMHRMSTEEREAMGMRGKQYCENNFDRTVLMDRFEGWMRGLVSA
jgi:glycosyltransferase involved in cell wall biosynthesis